MNRHLLSLLAAALCLAPLFASALPRLQPVLLENRTNVAVKVFWVDYDGNEQEQLVIAPGGTEQFQGYPTHILKLRSEDGKLLQEYTITDVINDSNTGSGGTGEKITFGRLGTFSASNIQRVTVGNGNLAGMRDVDNDPNWKAPTGWKRHFDQLGRMTNYWVGPTGELLLDAELRRRFPNGGEDTTWIPKGTFKASGPETNSVQLKIENGGKDNVVVFWVNQQGQLRPENSFVVVPGKPADLKSFAGASYVVADTKGQNPRYFQLPANAKGYTNFNTIYATADPQNPAQIAGANGQVAVRIYNDLLFDVLVQQAYNNNSKKTVDLYDKEDEKTYTYTLATVREWGGGPREILKSGETRDFKVSVGAGMQILTANGSYVIKDFSARASMNERGEVRTIRASSREYQDRYWLIDHENPIQDPIGDQGSEGACVAWAVCGALGTTVLRDYYELRNDKSPQASEFTRRGSTMFNAHELYEQRANTSKEGWNIPDALTKCETHTVRFRGMLGTMGYGVRISSEVAPDGKTRHGWGQIWSRDEMRKYLYRDWPLIANFTTFHDKDKSRKIPDHSDLAEFASGFAGFYTSLGTKEFWTKGKVTPQTIWKKVDSLDYNAYNQSIYRGPEVSKLTSAGGHAVLVVGYNNPKVYGSGGTASGYKPDATTSVDPFWTIHNSWGKDWGTHGYVDIAENVCQIDDVMWVILNWYLCDPGGHKIEDPNEQRKILDQIIGG